MIHRFSAFAFILLLLIIGCTNREEALPIKGLVERIAPQFADDILFEQMESPSGRDLFELESTGKGKILIRGNNFISMAMGFNHYLKCCPECRRKSEKRQRLRNASSSTIAPLDIPCPGGSGGIGSV